MIVYLAVGLAYMAVLEWYMQSGETPSSKFRFIDMCFHCLLWPLSMLVLIGEVIRIYRNK